ncbi:DUF6221 family protein [Streptomyces sp. NPDC048659]|uniref:DUF6221 family protein n=1 Tax=Streptomyces sp. NPDC048659 TaxID=3155489 RepID=UPI00341B5D20
MDLVEFLNARLDEDGRVALATAVSRGTPACYVWEASPEAGRASEWEVWTEERWRIVPGQTEADATHVARHDPARVLAEVDAKRRILELHGPAEYEYSDVDICSTCDRGGPLPHPCPTLHLLALPYADHPDYDEAWRPQ